MAMDKAQRRLELLRAASEVFAARGYHAAKIDDIVAEANVSKGTFYLYFTDKRAVFTELVDNLFVRLAAAIIRVDPSGDVDEQVKQNVRAIVGVLLADPKLTRIFFSYAAGLDPEFVQKVRAFQDSVLGILEQALRDGQTLGIVAEGDAAVYATFTFGGLKELILEAAAQGSPSPDREERVVEGVFRLLERGYLRAATATPSGG